jgi:hypothetical protein
MLLATWAAFQAAAEPPPLKVSPIADGYRVEVTSFDMSREAHVNGEVERKASELCGAKHINWGKFGSEAIIEKDPAKGSPKITGYYKEFQCVDEKEPVASSISSDWKATEADDADVRRIFVAYYAKRDRGDFQGASSMMSMDTRPSESDYPRLRDFNKALGKGTRRITNVTWYVNPASAPRLGAYAALDFVGQYESPHLYCGYLILYRQGPNAYEIVREEQNLVGRTAEMIDPVQLEQMRAGMCRGN